MLRVRDVWKTFNAGTPNEVRSLQGVNLDLDSGSFVIIIGTNGSGKSTLLNAVAGAWFVDAGKIELDGRDVTRWPEYKRAALLGLVFQNPFSGTAPNLSIAENVALWRPDVACGADWVGLATQTDGPDPGRGQPAQHGLRIASIMQSEVCRAGSARR